MIEFKVMKEQVQALITEHLNQLHLPEVLQTNWPPHLPHHLPTLAETTQYIPLLLIASVIAFVTLILLSVLVRYAMVFAITGTGVFVLLLANFPRNVSPDIVDGVILTGFTALTAMLFIYEFILWRQARVMRSIALASRERHLQRRMANRSRRTAY